MRNAEVAAMLDEIADLLELKGENRFRVGAYREAARRISSLPEDVATVAAEGRLEDIPRIGPSIAAKIEEYLHTGHLKYIEALRREVPSGLAALLQVPGLGPARAQIIYHNLGVKTIPELAAAARQHRLRQLPGIREKTEEKILREVERLQQRTSRLLLGVALPAAEEVVRMLRSNPAVRRIDPAGSIRRMRETIGDIDILVASDEPEAVMAAFTTLPIVKEVLAQGPTRASILTDGDLQIDLRVIAPAEYGSALQYFTGSKSHNIALRDIAIRQGDKLSEYGLFEVASGRRIAGETEEGIYEALGLQWMPPELREDRGELEAAAAGRLPRLVTLRDIQGDLHVHSDWSDGSASIEEMAEAARARGYEYVAITDHSKSLGVAHGLTPERVHEQRRVIDQLNQRLAPFRILAGTEVDIRADGTLDFDDDLLRQFDVVTASVHSAFGQPREVMTARIVKALQNPYVDVLNHPTGRIIGRRDPYEVDLEAVLQAAARFGKALEIDGAPDRLDLDDVWSRRAKDLGIMLAVDTDAHGPEQLGQMRYGMAIARRGWLEKRDVLNALPLSKLLARLSRHHRAA